MAILPVIVHVTCPLCGEDIGPMRGEFARWPWSLFQAEVTLIAHEHCFDRHPDASGAYMFHIESDSTKTGNKASDGYPVISSFQFEGLEPVVLPLPPGTRRLFRRQRTTRARHAEADAVFL